MKVFLSWSGELSHRVAGEFRDWLPDIIHDVKPYLSSLDMDKGTRWSTEIAGELDASAFGLVFVTRQNMNAAWMNFEAGALSKSVEKSRVVPFLFNVKPAELKGPLVQFQYASREKEDVRKILVSLNNAFGDRSLERQRLDRAFEMWWPQLDQKLEKLAGEVEIESESASQLPPTQAILEELLELVRSQNKLLSSPSELLPSDYLAKVVGAASRQDSRSVRVMIDVLNAIGSLTSIDANGASSDQLKVVISKVRGMVRVARSLSLVATTPHESPHYLIGDPRPMDEVRWRAGVASQICLEDLRFEDVEEPPSPAPSPG